MRRLGNIKWIPTIDLEPADPHCSTASHHASLSALTQSNTGDSSSRSSVSYNTVREESNNSWHSILDIINEFAHNQHRLFPSTGSQRSVLHQNRNTSNIAKHRINDRFDRKPMMDYLWKCASESLGIEVTDDEDQDNNNKSMERDAVINDVTINGITVPFDDKPNHCLDGKTESCSSLHSETDAEYLENDEHKLKEPSISYTIEDMNCITPIPPQNTSKLYAFLFDSIDTDSDDDIFPTSSIQLDDFKITHDITNRNKNINTVCKPLSELL